MTISLLRPPVSGVLRNPRKVTAVRLGMVVLDTVDTLNPRIPLTTSNRLLIISKAAGTSIRVSTAATR